MDGPDRDAAGAGRRGGMRRGTIAITVLVLCAYASLSLAFFGSTGSWSTRYLGQGGDPLQFMWFLNWWPFAAANGINPFWTHFVWYPHGFDLSWATAVPALASVAAPLTLMTNAVVSFNFISVLNPALAAWTAYLLSREITRDDVAALLAGFLFGFSSYEIGQTLGHLNLDTIALIPLIPLLMVRRYRATLSRRGFIGLTALVLWLQSGISLEVFATLITFGVIAGVIFWLSGDRATRHGLQSLAVETAIALGFTTLAASPTLYYLARGAYTVPAVINSTVMFSADPVNYLLPTIVTEIGHRLAAPIIAHLSGNAAEQGAYLGAPLVGILLFCAWRYRGDRSMRALLIIIAVIIIASLGPVLHLAGRLTGVRLPWSWTRQMPLIRSALPTRFTLYVSLAASVVVAKFLADGAGRQRWGRIGVALLACVFLLPNQGAYHWSTVPQAPSLLGNSGKQLLGPSPNVIILPFGASGPDMAWQFEAGMSFTQAGGYVGFSPRQAQAWPVLGDFQQARPGPQFSNDLASFCALHRVTDILLAPDTPKPLVQAVEQLGWPRTVRPDLTIIKVPPRQDIDFYLITGDYWPSPASRFNWIGRSATVLTGAHPLALSISGIDRPASLKPDIVTISTDGRSKSYAVLPSSRFDLVIPPNTTTILRAASTFVPARVMHTQDYRHLSVSIAAASLPAPIGQPPR
ncbi:hypothetical protein [Acidiphilium sp.]|uniref:hypothetical protein n=1 Tax=Acidiphilium sp. TaxID=527 RepID=UPI003D08F9C9